jgi:DNA primase
VVDFQLGYSPGDGQGLRQHLLGQGFRDEELAATGLVVERDGERHDLFRGRLMFPIRDARGRVLGFGARALDASLPKYLNSPQTTLFDKGGLLYGLDRARGSIRREGRAVIVEGYMDVIAAHQAGFENAVASMGTALSAKQITLLKGLARNLVLALDADAAGDMATLRGIEVARQALGRQAPIPTWLGATTQLQVEVSIASLPQGKDPEDVIRENPAQWHKLVEEASPLMDFLIKAVTSRYSLARPSERSAAAQELLPLIAEMGDEIQRELYLRKLASLLGVGERTLAGMAARLRTTPRERREAAQEPTPRVSGDPLEEYCLALLFKQPYLKGLSHRLAPEHFERTENREVFSLWQKVASLEELQEGLDESLKEHLAYLLALAQELPPASEEVEETALADCLDRLEERRLRRLKAQEALLLSEARDQDLLSLSGGLRINEELRALFLKKDRRRTRTQQEEDRR